MKEIWKEIKDYEGLYWVSNLGRIKSKRKILKPNLREYAQVRLSKNGIQTTLKVHRLVAQEFVERKNKEDIYVNHKDENKYNNNANNLEWCSHKYNDNYGSRNERISKSQSKYKIVQKDKNNNIVKIWDSMWELTHNTSYKKDNISYCCRGKYKYAYGYKWEYITL